MKQLVLSLLLLLPVFLPMLVSAQAENYVTNIDYQLEQPFGGLAEIRDLAQYINAVYQFALGIVGIIAVVLMMAGGVGWIAAAGNESAITQAKELITSAVIGLTIALLSYIILAFINPQFTTASLAVPMIRLNPQSSIIDLPTCDSSAFVGKICQNVDTRVDMNCENITCNQQGYLEADQNYCRGIDCTGTGGGCYRGPVDPMAYACQKTDCGMYAQNCADHGDPEIPASIDPILAYHECACGYYETVIPPLLGMTTDLRPEVLTEEQEATFLLLCSEEKTQEYWESTIASNPAAYGYRLDASSTVLKGWDCGFECADAAGYFESGLGSLACSFFRT